MRGYALVPHRAVSYPQYNEFHVRISLIRVSHIFICRSDSSFVIALTIMPYTATTPPYIRSCALQSYGLPTTSFEFIATYLLIICSAGYAIKTFTQYRLRRFRTAQSKTPVKTLQILRWCARVRTFVQLASFVTIRECASKGDAAERTTPSLRMIMLPLDGSLKCPQMNKVYEHPEE
jgi:hypothetical protein